MRLLHSRRARARDKWGRTGRQTQSYYRALALFALESSANSRVSVFDLRNFDRRTYASRPSQPADCQLTMRRFERGYSKVERGAVSSRENSRRASASGWMSASAPFHSAKNASYDFRADSISRLIAAARAWPRYASG